MNLLLRLCPLVPYNLMNLLLGLTATRVEDYAIGCFVGTYVCIDVISYLYAHTPSLTPHTPTKTTTTGMLPPVILLSHFGAGLDTPEAIGDFPARSVLSPS